MAVDHALLITMPLPSNHPFQILPGTKLTAIIFFCYLAAGIFTALLSLVTAFLEKKVFPKHTLFTEKLPLAIALILSAFVNIFVLVKSPKVPFLGTGSWPIRFLTAAAALFLVFVFVSAGLPRLKKRLAVSVTAVCVAGELFWCFVRGSFLKGGIFAALTPGWPISVILIIACVLFCTVFFLIYNIIPGLMSRAGFCLAITGFIVCFGTGNTRIQAAEPGGTHAPPNIVLIILDTLRADHLSCYGYSKDTTPNIDRFATKAVKYTNAYSAASWTLPSISSIITGKYPGSHGAHRTEDGNSPSPFNILDPSQVTLAETLRGKGYTTAGIVTCQVVTEHYGLHQGFDYFDDTIPSTLFIMPTFAILQFLNAFFPLDDYFAVQGLNESRVAKQVNRSARTWFENKPNRKPFFLLLHYYDAHHPYYPEKLGTSSGAIPPAIRNRYRGKSKNYAEMERRLISSVQTGKKPLRKNERDYLVNNYDREITLLDKKVAEILDLLKKKGLYDNSIIIITADHGESFGEHNLMLHGICLYEDNLHVPLLIKYPSGTIPAGTRNYPVSLTGIVPTLLSFLSIPVPEGVQGASFDSPEKQVVFAQNYQSPHSKWRQPFASNTASLRQGNFKYIRFFQTQDQFFNLLKDPGEEHNIIASETVTANKTSLELDRFFERLSLSKTENTGKTSEVDKATLENLKTLGYID